MEIVLLNTLPKLYKKTTTGAIQEWRISLYVIDGVATIISNYGQVDGKIQESREQVLVGKNIGKLNETTPIKQAADSKTSNKRKGVNPEDGFGGTLGGNHE